MSWFFRKHEKFANREDLKVLHESDVVSCEKCWCLLKRENARKVASIGLFPWTGKTLMYCAWCKPLYDTINQGPDKITYYKNNVPVNEWGELIIDDKKDS